VSAVAYPEWAVSEDGERVWVRHDLEDQALELCAEVLDHGWSTLERAGVVACWLDLVDTEWSGDWLLRPIELEPEPVEAVLYVELDVILR
jgi:hypothetical protein